MEFLHLNGYIVEWSGATFCIDLFHNKIVTGNQILPVTIVIVPDVLATNLIKKLYQSCLFVMACLTMLAGMKFSITGTQNSQAKRSFGVQNLFLWPLCHSYCYTALQLQTEYHHKHDCQEEFDTLMLDFVFLLSPQTQCMATGNLVFPDLLS